MQKSCCRGPSCGTKETFLRQCPRALICVGKRCMFTQLPNVILETNFMLHPWHIKTGLLKDAYSVYGAVCTTCSRVKARRQKSAGLVESAYVSRKRTSIPDRAHSQATPVRFIDLRPTLVGSLRSFERISAISDPRTANRAWNTCIFVEHLVNYARLFDSRRPQLGPQQLSTLTVTFTMSWFHRFSAQPCFSLLLSCSKIAFLGMKSAGQNDAPNSFIWS